MHLPVLSHNRIIWNFMCNRTDQFICHGLLTLRLSFLVDANHDRFLRSGLSRKDSCCGVYDVQTVEMTSVWTASSIKEWIKAEMICNYGFNETMESDPLGSYPFSYRNKKWKLKRTTLRDQATRVGVLKLKKLSGEPPLIEIRSLHTERVKLWNILH